MTDRSEYHRAYRSRPEVKERRAATQKRWKIANGLARAPGEPRRRRAPKENPIGRLQTQRNWRARNFARHLFHRCKSAATRKGLPFDLTVEHLERLLEPMRCSVTGAELVIANQGERHPLLPSIDQREPGFGYTLDNVRIVSWIYNRAKGAGTDKEVLEMALALVSQSAMKSSN